MQLRLAQRPDDPGAPARQLPATIGTDVRSALLIKSLGRAKMLGELVACERVGVRSETLSAPKCPGFIQCGVRAGRPLGHRTCVGGSRRS